MPLFGLDRDERVITETAAAFAANGWCVRAVIESPVRGARGARELLLHAQRCQAP